MGIVPFQDMCSDLVFQVASVLIFGWGPWCRSITYVAKYPHILSQRTVFHHFWFLTGKLSLLIYIGEFTGRKPHKPTGMSLKYSSWLETSTSGASSIFGAPLKFAQKASYLCSHQIRPMMICCNTRRGCVLTSTYPLRMRIRCQYTALCQIGLQNISQVGIGIDNRVARVYFARF